MSALKEGERHIQGSKTLGSYGAVSPEIKCASKQGFQSDTLTGWKGELLGQGVEMSPAPSSTLRPAPRGSFTALGFAHLTQFHQPRPLPVSLGQGRAHRVTTSRSSTTESFNPRGLIHCPTLLSCKEPVSTWTGPPSTCQNGVCGDRRMNKTPPLSSRA